jgi:carboxypeptidase D
MLNYNNIFTLNDSYVATLEGLHQSCGYAAYMEMALTFPPAGKFPAPPSTRGCSTRSLVTAAALELNPCFNIYHLTDYCPFLWDELGFPSLAMGPNNYFNQSDVQKALHVPPTNYVICGDDALFPRGDQSPPSSFVALPHVIEHTNNVIVGSGLLDYLLLTNGTLMTLNNMTWNGKQGFQTAPKDDFFVPYNPTIAIAAHGVQYQMIPPIQIGYVGGGGIMGVTHTERGLTWVTVDLAGHEIPQYVPGAAYRQLEKLLGRIPSLTAVGPFTTQGGNYTVPPPSSCSSKRRSAPAHHVG